MPNILYSFRRCPYAMRARMGLMSAGIDYEHREIILRDKPASMLEASPKGTVPVFIKSGGQVIEQSMDIMLWALGENDPQGWLTCDMNAALALAQACEAEFKPHLDRYKYASRYKDDTTRGELDLEHRAKAENYVKTLEDRLSDNAYLTGNAPRLPDYAIFSFIRQFANTDRDWWDDNNYPKTRDWLENFLVSEIFLRCMKKHDLWDNDHNKGSTETVNC